VDEPARKWWHVSPKRVVIALLVVFSLVLLIGKAMEWIAPWAEAKAVLRDNPALDILPAPLTDRNLATLSDSQVELFGLTVHTPWGAFGTIRSAHGFAAIPFPERHVEMLLYEPHVDSFEKEMWNHATQASPIKTGISSYNLMAAEMSTTPDQVKWWRGRSRNEACNFLLEMKSLNLGGLRAIYMVNAGKLQGFQEGDPSVRPSRVRLDLFDLTDRHYEFVIASKNNDEPAFSQADINAVLASLKFAPQN
jgi:hypothetical protein